MPRSPLLAALSRMVREERPPTRRQFLKAAAAIPVMMQAPASAKTAPRIAIIGAGVAGLHAAWTLKRLGLASTVYESSKRTGGRMYSARDVAAPGVTTELGGEFIDTSHTEILGLARHFGLELIDTRAPGEAHLHAEAFFIGGSLRQPAAIAAQFREVSARLARDVRDSRGRGYKRYDRMSIAEYLTQMGVSGWLRALLEVAYLTEYGMDTGEQSAMNLISLIAPELAGERILLFGESDERYKIQGGNQLICDGLARDVADQIRLEHRLSSIAESGGGYRLSFDNRPEVAADVVVVTVPFTILRSLELRVPLPEKKRRAIRELGYGTNAKLFLGFEKRLWRDLGYGGNLFTDLETQLVWDSSRLQPTTPGALTMLVGGGAGVKIGQGTPEQLEARLLPLIDPVWSGLAKLRSGKAARFHWPYHPHTLGSYASYSVGQWASLRGHEGGRAGNLYFAGEHCSLQAQGYMEGGAETGKRAALDIARRAGRQAKAA